MNFSIVTVFERKLFLPIGVKKINSSIVTVFERKLVLSNGVKYMN